MTELTPIQLSKLIYTNRPADEGPDFPVRKQDFWVHADNTNTNRNITTRAWNCIVRGSDYYFKLLADHPNRYALPHDTEVADQYKADVFNVYDSYYRQAAMWVSPEPDATISFNALRATMIGRERNLQILRGISGTVTVQFLESFVEGIELLAAQQAQVNVIEQTN